MSEVISDDVLREVPFFVDFAVTFPDGTKITGAPVFQKTDWDGMTPKERAERLTAMFAEGANIICKMMRDKDLFDTP